jgi:predicted RNase H-like nuclease (RuvC/YqgF family)
MKAMTKQGNGSDRINNSQRKTLAKLAVEVLDKKIQQARDESGELVAQIRSQVREELGVAAMDMEIEEMERRIQVLKKKKEQLGFNQYHDRLLPGSEAKMLVDKRTGTACKKVKDLEEEKTDAISGIWTSTTLSQALSILESVKAL